MDHRWVLQNEEPHHPYVQCSACGLSGYEPMPKEGCQEAVARQLLRQREADLQAEGAVRERDRLRPLLQAALDRLTGTGPQCPAFIRHGPGHQSATRCQVKGPHEIHEARYGKFDLEAKWRSEVTCTGFFDDMPEVDLGDDGVRRTAEQGLIEALKAEIARTGGGA